MSKYERLEPVFAEPDSGDEDIYPIFNTDYVSEEDIPRRKTPFLVIGSLLILAFAGGGLVFAYKQGVREGNRTAPPIIKASARPIKTAPVKPGGITIPNQNKRVYDRLDKKPVKVTERLMPSAEEIMDLPKKPEANGGIIIENPPVTAGNSTIANPAEGGGVDAGSFKILKLPDVAAAPVKALSENTAPLPTHEVDVFTITPDGVFPGASPAVSDAPEKVAEKAAAGVPAPEPVATPEPAPVAPMPIAAAPQQPAISEKISNPPIQIGELPEMVDGKTLTERLLEAESALAKRGGGAAANTTTPPRVAGVAPVKNSSRLSPGLDPAGSTASVTDTPVRVAGLLPPIPRRKPARALAAQPALIQPARTRPAAPEKRVQPAVSGRGRFVVQIASHRRQVDALAEFAGLKRRHPDVIGKYKPSIQRADLGDRGIYYRLRIGPLASKADAASFCETLKTAGKNDCLIRRR